MNETETIRVSLKYPERVPYPFKVYTSDKLVGVEPNTTYQGYVLVIRVHPCDVLGQGSHEAFPFKAHLFSTKEIVVEVPVLDYTDMGKDDDFVRSLFREAESSSSDDESENEANKMQKENYVLMEALDVGRNKLNDRINNKIFPVKKQYRVVFEDDVELSSEVLNTHKAFKDTSCLHLLSLAD